MLLLILVHVDVLTDQLMKVVGRIFSYESYEHRYMFYESILLFTRRTLWLDSYKRT